MDRLRQTASALMLLSGVTHTVQYLFLTPSPTNTTSAFGFGLGYFVVGVLLLRPGRAGLWLGAVLAGIGAVLASLVALGNPGPLPIVHAAIDWIVFPICSYLLRKPRPEAT